MTTFIKGRTLKTAEAVVTVDAGLDIGTHRFQLVVVGSDGRQSAPEVVDVEVSRKLVIDPLRPPIDRPPLLDPVQPPITRPPITRPPLIDPLQPTVTRPPVTPVVTPVVTPAIPRKTSAPKAGKSKPGKPAKPRSET